MGLIYGLFLYRKPESKASDFKFVILLIISSLIVLGVVKIFVDSLWINILYKKAYLAVISARIIVQIIMLPVQVITIYILDKAISPFAKKYLYEQIAENEEIVINKEI